jgi:hypothetical protein
MSQANPTGATKNTATPLNNHHPPNGQAHPSLLPESSDGAISLLHVSQPQPPTHSIERAPYLTPGRSPSLPASKPSSAGRRPPSGSVPDFKSCNCRNSKCLKLYCECFASGRYCGGCNCSNCMNNTSNELARSKAIEAILERNANAFRPKIQFQQVCIKNLILSKRRISCR